MACFAGRSCALVCQPSHDERTISHDSFRVSSSPGQGQQIITDDSRTPERRRSIYLDHDGGDVVLAAALVGETDETLHGFFATEAHDRRNVFVVQIAMQPVAAE